MIQEGKLKEQIEILYCDKRLHFDYVSVSRLVTKAKKELPIYEKVYLFREKNGLYEYSLDSLYISILAEWIWKWLGVNIFTFEKRPMNPEIQKWFGE